MRNNRVSVFNRDEQDGQDFFVFFYDCGDPAPL